MTMRTLRNIRITAIVLILAAFLSFPVGALVVGAFAEASLAGAIVGSLILVQWPLMAWLRRHGKLPAASSIAEDR
jgi:hypothetical protein